jgi:hypothetical protein
MYMYLQDRYRRRSSFHMESIHRSTHTMTIYRTCGSHFTLTLFLMSFSFSVYVIAASGVRQYHSSCSIARSCKLSNVSPSSMQHNSSEWQRGPIRTARLSIRRRKVESIRIHPAANKPELGGGQGKRAMWTQFKGRPVIKLFGSW